MKKTFAVLLTLVMLICSVAFAEEAADQTGTYTIYNKTGETVVELTLTDNVTGEVSENYAGEGLKADTSIAVSTSLAGSEDGSHRFTLAFKTESGYEGSFGTLSIEVVPITLLAADAMTGATAISFSVPDQIGVYTIYNKTGETVVELTMTDNVTGEVSENYAAEGIKADGSLEITTTLAGTEDGSHRYTLSFKTEGGYEGTFGTLSVEIAPITLLAADAMTGATAISFSIPDQVGTYTIYNKTGETVVELTLTDNVTGEVSENFAADGIKADESTEISATLSGREDGSHRYTLSFKTEGGYEGSFATLSIEVVPITLLSSDALTGATQIAFKIPE